LRSELFPPDVREALRVLHDSHIMTEGSCIIEADGQLPGAIPVRQTKMRLGRSGVAEL
jgi:hypothetical protein